MKKGRYKTNKNQTEVHFGGEGGGVSSPVPFNTYRFMELGILASRKPSLTAGAMFMTAS